MADEKVKCAECNMLMVKDRYTGKSEPAPIDTRTSGWYSSHGQTAYTPDLLCHAGEKEFPHFVTKTSLVDHINEGIDAPCSFDPFNASYSPKENEEMELQKSLIAFGEHLVQIQLQMAQNQRDLFDLKKEVAEQSKSQYEETQKDVKSHHRVSIWVQIGVGLLGILVPLFSIYVGYLIASSAQNSSVPVINFPSNITITPSETENSNSN